jgi:ABC-2 type transport system ATP-binding protein
MIQVDHLTKRYGQHIAVTDVSFRCEPGSVTGFLGPNGAGKSTTLRMICGLARPTSGRAAIAGRPYAALPNPGRQVGVLLDAAAQHPGRTGRATLQLAAAVLGVAAPRVGEVLDLVELAERTVDNHVHTYSLGQRQRLGLAHALLGAPPVLVLDEPTGGLDPGGIRWLRRLLRGHADAGGTVLLSSHQLPEVARIADRVVVIAEGRVVAQGEPPADDDLEATYLRLTGGVASDD